MFGLGMQELVIILVIVLVLFGAKRLPELASGMGKAIKNFKKATNEPDEIDVTPKKNVESDVKQEGEEKGKSA
jgi:sec-independent protein translocase protein TatA